MRRFDNKEKAHKQYKRERNKEKKSQPKNITGVRLGSPTSALNEMLGFN